VLRAHDDPARRRDVARALERHEGGLERVGEDFERADRVELVEAVEEEDLRVHGWERGAFRLRRRVAGMTMFDRFLPSAQNGSLSESTRPPGMASPRRVA